MCGVQGRGSCSSEPAGAAHDRGAPGRQLSQVPLCALLRLPPLCRRPCAPCPAGGLGDLTHVHQRLLSPSSFPVYLEAATGKVEQSACPGIVAVASEHACRLAAASVLKDGHICGLLHRLRVKCDGWCCVRGRPRLMACSGCWRSSWGGASR